MKKVLLSLSVLALSNWANAQTGNVGINTENPTETLNVNGTLRINELPVVNGKIRTTPTGTASATKNQNFTPTKMVVVDNNGVVGKADIPSSGAIYQGSNSISLETNNSFQREALTGDATAAKNSNATKVVAIQGKPVATTAPNNNQVLQWNGSQWAPANLPAQTTYAGSASVALEGNAFQREALTGDATAAKNSNTTKVVAIQNKPVAETAPTDNQVLQWKNNAWTPATLDIPTLPKDAELGTGTVIAVGGKMQIAEEITATMTDKDVSIGSTTGGNPREIPHLTKITVNNQGLFKPTTTGNSFKVSQNGTYQIMMNVHITPSAESIPVIGIWNNNTNKWVARISNYYSGSRKQTITLMTAVDLTKDATYSFRFANAASTTIHGYSTGNTGEGPATFVSLKQLK